MHSREEIWPRLPGRLDHAPQRVGEALEQAVGGIVRSDGAVEIDENLPLAREGDNTRLLIERGRLVAEAKGASLSWVYTQGRDLLRSMLLCTYALDTYALCGAFGTFAHMRMPCQELRSR